MRIFLRGHNNLICIKTSTSPVGCECLWPDQRQELTGDLLTVRIRKEEKQDEREEDHPHHLVKRSGVHCVDNLIIILYLQIIQ